MNKFPAIVASILAAACLSTAAFADPGMPPPPPGSPPPAGAPDLPPPPGGHAPSPEMFQRLKTRMLGNQQQRIQILQQTSSCMQAAATMEQLKDCHEKEHQALMQMRQMKPQK